MQGTENDIYTGHKNDVCMKNQIDKRKKKRKINVCKEQKYDM